MYSVCRVCALLLVFSTRVVQTITLESAALPAADDVDDLPFVQSAYAHFEAPGFDAAAQLWRDTGRRNFIGFHVGGTRAKLQPEQNMMGSHVSGTVDTKFSFGLVVPKDSFTLCSMTRYGKSELKGTILVGSNEHWYHGHHRGVAGVYRYGSAHKPVYRTQPAGMQGWVAICGSSQGAGDAGDQELVVNHGILGERAPSSWGIAEVVVFDRALTDEQMHEVEEYLRLKYVPGFNPMSRALNKLDKRLATPQLRRGGNAADEADNDDMVEYTRKYYATGDARRGGN